MTCAVIGDSIAVDIGRAMPECATKAMIGIGSAAIVGRAGPAGMCIVSAGSNDPRNPNLGKNLEAIRARCGGRVIWVLPIDLVARAAVRQVATRHGDAVVSFAPAADNVHPHFIAPLVAAVREAERQ